MRALLDANVLIALAVLGMVWAAHLDLVIVCLRAHQISTQSAPGGAFAVVFSYRRGAQLGEAKPYRLDL